MLLLIELTLFTARLFCLGYIHMYSVVRKYRYVYTYVHYYVYINMYKYSVLREGTYVSIYVCMHRHSVVYHSPGFVARYGKFNN